MTAFTLEPSPAPDRATQAIDLALELVDAVRCWQRDRVQTIVDRADAPALLVVLAAMVDDNRPVIDLLGWVPPAKESTPRNRRRYALQPCGTHAAHNRHVDRGEPVDPLCAAAESRYQRARSIRRRQQRHAAHAAGGQQPAA